MSIEEKNNIYLEIANIIWRVMPLEARKYVVKYEVNTEVGQSSVFWEMDNGNRGDIDLEKYPREQIKKIGSLLKELKMKMKGEWNHCTFTLFDNTEFKIEFSYVDEEDTWPGLFMKGVSELTKEEAEEAYIPLDYWEERVRIKNSKS